MPNRTAEGDGFPYRFPCGIEQTQDDGVPLLAALDSADAGAGVPQREQALCFRSVALPSGAHLGRQEIGLIPTALREYLARRRLSVEIQRIFEALRPNALAGLLLKADEEIVMNGEGVGRGAEQGQVDDSLPVADGARFPDPLGKEGDAPRLDRKSVV